MLAPTAGRWPEPFVERAAKVHPHVQVAAFNVRRRNPAEIRLKSGLPILTRRTAATTWPLQHGFHALPDFPTVGIFRPAHRAGKGRYIPGESFRLSENVDNLTLLESGGHAELALRS